MVKLNKNKRAQGPLDLLVGAIIIVLIAIITVSIGISVLSPITTSLRGDVVTVTNESHTNGWSNSTYRALNNVDIVSIAIAVNSTDFGESYDLIFPANYTLDASTGRVRLIFDAATSFEDNSSYVNYTYYTHGEAYNASSQGTTGMAAFADYWVSIVSIIILIVIVGLFAYFRGGGGIQIR